MKITRIRTGILKTRLKTPFKTAVRSAQEMVNVIVKAETDEGFAGFGSAPPTAKVTGDTVESILGAVNGMIAPQLIGADANDLMSCLDLAEGAIERNTSAKAAVDIALHDLWARSIGQPFWKLLGGDGRSIRTDVTVSIDAPEKMKEDALAAKAQGFDTVKIKLGIDAALDFERLEAIRQAVGDKIKIRVDANQGWTPKEAVRLLERMQAKGYNIDVVEQPVKAHDLAGMAYVTARSPYPVAADESCWSPADALKLLGMGAADIVNIKLMKCAGIRAARQIVAISESMGAEVMIGSMLEGSVSSAAAVHLASSCKAVTRMDIDGPILSVKEETKGGPVYDGPTITPNRTPGFGIEEIPGVAWLD